MECGLLAARRQTQDSVGTSRVMKRRHRAIAGREIPFAAGTRALLVVKHSATMAT
jgi:hypothetical protein